MSNAESDYQLAELQKIFDLLIRRARDVSRRRYGHPDEIFELAKTDKYPESISDLAESFGMMIVKVEARELRYEKTIKKLQKLNHELQEQVRERMVAEKTVQVFMDIVDNIDIGLCVYHMADVQRSQTLQLVAANVAARKMAARFYHDESDPARIFPGMDIDLLVRSYREMMQSGSSAVLDDIPFLSDTGEQIWYHVKAIYLPNDSMGITYVNVTDRRTGLESS